MTGWLDEFINETLPATLGSLLQEQLSSTLPESTAVSVELIGNLEACVTFTYRRVQFACNISLASRWSNHVFMLDHTGVNAEGYEEVDGQELLDHAGELLRLLDTQSCATAFTTYEQLT